MRNLRYILICCAGLILSACENKWPKNGDLDGQWQLLTIEHDGEIRSVKDSQYYLSFQLDLFQLSIVNNRQRYFGYFDRNANTIVFRQFSDMAENDLATTDNRPLTEQQIPVLQQWGYYKLNESFTIETLSGSDMVLKSDSARITYRKF